MSLLTVGIALSWAFLSLKAGLYGVKTLAPGNGSASAGILSLWRISHVRFAACAILWPLGVFFILSFSLIIVLLFWDILFMGDAEREEIFGQGNGVR